MELCYLRMVSMEGSEQSPCWPEGGAGLEVGLPDWLGGVVEPGPGVALLGFLPYSARMALMSSWSRLRPGSQPL